MGWAAVGTIGSTAANGSNGAPGQRGTDGTKVLVGSAAPSLLQGSVGDLYFQTPPAGATGPILIPGPQGIPGIPGVGLQGAQGQQGFSTDATYVVPKLSTFTLTNAIAGATWTQSGNGLLLYCPANNGAGDNFAIKAIPASTPYSCIFRVTIGKPAFTAGGHQSAGVAWVNAAGHTFKFIGYTYSSALGGDVLEIGKSTAGDYATIADYNSSLSGCQNYLRWFKLSDDGTNQTYSVSDDGTTWIVVFSQLRNTDVTPTHVGVYCAANNASSVDAYIKLWSYQETSP